MRIARSRHCVNDASEVLAFYVAKLLGSEKFLYREVRLRKHFSTHATIIDGKLRSGKLARFAPLRSGADWAKLPTRVMPMKSVLEVLTSTTEYFKGKGVESPRLNIEHLLAHVLGKKSRMEIYLEFDRPLGNKELDALRELVKKRSQGIPLQHLLGTTEFHGRTFVTDSRALVPRPETEHFVELLLKLELPTDVRCLDVGTGSGVIALTLAAERPEARVQAVDRSRNALGLARENAAKLGLENRVEFLEGDLFEPCAGPYDLIAANLPYIPVGDIAGLAREVQHDPMMALDGGKDGLEIIARCVAQAPGKLAPGGRLGLEIGHDQAPRVQELLAAAGYVDVRVVPDFQETDRFVFATRP